MTVSNPYESPSQEADKPTQTFRRRPRFLSSCGLAVCGMAVALIGVMYGAWFIGVPTPDATPDMARVEAIHGSVSTSLVVAGIGLFLLGIVAVVVSSAVWLLRKAGEHWRQGRNSKQQPGFQRGQDALACGGRLLNSLEVEVSF